MFAIGHFALGYLAGKGSSKLLNVKINLPLIFLVSVIPDIDLFFQFSEPALLFHRGPTHSLITFTVLMIPLIIIYRKQALPYFAALLTHPLIGDFFTGGAALFWPISPEWVGLNYDVQSLGNAITEITLFAIMLTIMLYARDLQQLWQPRLSNLALIIPLGAVLGPLLQIGHSNEGSIPPLLIVPSLFWVAVFAYSILISLCSTLEKPPPDESSAKPPPASAFHTDVSTQKQLTPLRRRKSGVVYGQIRLPNLSRRIPRNRLRFQQTNRNHS
jgi:membrane-bound metal-dependent hydrolase YbcI (DUF457 family)